MLFWHIDGHHKLKRFLSQNYALAVFIAICVYFPILYLIVVVGTCLCIKTELMNWIGILDISFRGVN